MAIFWHNHTAAEHV